MINTSLRTNLLMGIATIPMAACTSTPVVESVAAGVFSCFPASIDATCEASAVDVENGRLLVFSDKAVEPPHSNVMRIERIETEARVVMVHEYAGLMQEAYCLCQLRAARQCQLPATRHR